MDDLRKKQVEELQKRQVEESQKRAIMRQLLDDSAFSRLSNIRLANQDLYNQLVMLLMRLYQSGTVRGKISEKQLVELLTRLSGQKRETKIQFMRK